jgi:hypothetical protein
MEFRMEYLCACFLSVAGPSRIRSLFPKLVLPALSMPLARRKKVVLTKDDASLSTAAATTPVYLIPQTGEIFTDYE